MITRPLHILQCNHPGGDGCANPGAGHATRPMQERLAAATPSKWVDGIIVRSTSDGWIGIAPLGRDEATVWVWHHADLTEQLSPGAPVALHSVYNVLANGPSRVSVVRI